MIGMLYHIKKNKVNHEIKSKLTESELTNLSTQLLITDELAFTVINSGYINNFGLTTLTLLEEFEPKSWPIINDTFFTLTGNMLYLAEQISPCQYLIANTDFISYLFDIMIKIDSNHGIHLENSIIQN